MTFILFAQHKINEYTHYTSQRSNSLITRLKVFEVLILHTNIHTYMCFAIHNNYRHSSWNFTLSSNNGILKASPSAIHWKKNKWLININFLNGNNYLVGYWFAIKKTKTFKLYVEVLLPASNNRCLKSYFLPNFFVLKYFTNSGLG